MNMAAALSSIGWICPPTPTRRYSTTRVRCSLKPPPPTPWLVLPPEERAYKFYSIAEDRVLTLKKKEDGSAAPPRDALLVGSSHGWLALWDKESHRVFLSNPISGRHVSLPPYPWNPKRIILSSSPDDLECYAVQHDNNLAYCAVGASDWTEIAASCDYEDLAYCSSRRALSLITYSSFKFDSGGVRMGNFRSADHEIDYWDLGRNSEVGSTWFWKFQGPPHHWKENEDGDLLTKHCRQELHLVYAAGAGASPLIVVRFVRHIESGATDACTEGFVVLEIDGEDRSIRVVDDLKGDALFVGANHSFAIPAGSGAGVLKPNCIYFAPSSPSSTLVGTFDYQSQTSVWEPKSSSTEVGIFDYQSKTFSYFHDKQLGNSSNCHCPMWFTPNSL